MTAVGLILMGLFVALGWVILDPRFRIAFQQGVYGKTDAEAREQELRPSHLAMLWAGRVSVTWFYLGLVAVAVFRLGGHMIDPVYWSSLAVGAATWTIFYFWLARKG